MVIRVATERDFPEVEDKIYEFNTEFFGIALNMDKLERWFNQHLENGVVFLSKDGLISALVIEDPVRDHIVVAETAWYDTGRTGITLLRQLIGFARELQADELRMTTLNTTPAGVLTLLNRTGFEEIERSHRLLL